jgi:hypothetical protein
MQSTPLQVSPEQIEALRARHPLAPDQTWVVESVREGGWTETTRRYLESERQRGHGEMQDLLLELGLAAVTSPEQATDLLQTAVEVYATHDPALVRVERQSPTGVRIEITDCPGYQLMESQDWHGMTACSSWYRRRGWLDALGVDAQDSVLAERKWGDPACVTEIQVTRVRHSVA